MHELQTRAVTYLETRSHDLLSAAEELGASPQIMTVQGVTPEMFMKLAENGVKTLDDFADLAGDEIVEMLGNSMLSIDVANEMIMAARAHWFEDEK